MNVVQLVNSRRPRQAAKSLRLGTSSEPPSPNRNYACDYDDCFKAFARKSDLQRHMRIHTNDRPFTCKVRECGKSFIQRSALTVHSRVHTGERPHACETCRKAFADSSSLARHRRIHTGDKPYMCVIPDCERQFCRKVTLTRHYRSAHPDFAPPQSYQVPDGSRIKSSHSRSYSSSSESSNHGQDYPRLNEPFPPHGFAAPYPSKGAAELFGDGRTHKRQVPHGAYFPHAHPYLSTGGRKGLTHRPKLVPWHSQGVGGFQPDQLAMPQGQLPIPVLGKPIRLRIMHSPRSSESDEGDWTPEPELVDVHQVPSFTFSNANSNMTFTPIPMGYDNTLHGSHSDMLHTSRMSFQPPPLQRYHSSPDFNVLVNTGQSYDSNSGMYTPQTAAFDANSVGGARSNGEDSCEWQEDARSVSMSYTPLEDSGSSKSLWGPDIQYPAVPTGVPLHQYSPMSASSSLVNGRSISQASNSATLAPLSITPSPVSQAGEFPTERKPTDGTLAPYPMPEAVNAEYQTFENHEGYYTPTTPATVCWQTSPQMPSYVHRPLTGYAMHSQQPHAAANMHRMPSETGVIGLGIANVSMDDRLDVGSECDGQGKEEDAEPERGGSPDLRWDEDDFPDADEDDSKDPDYIDVRPKNRARRNRKNQRL